MLRRPRTLGVIPASPSVSTAGLPTQALHSICHFSRDNGPGAGLPGLPAPWH